MKKVFIFTMLLVWISASASEEMVYESCGEYTSTHYSHCEKEYKSICKSVKKAQKAMVFSADSCISDDIIKYIKLGVELNKDTVSIGDELLLTVLFTNTSDRTVCFYPKGMITINHEFIFNGYFDGGQPSYVLRCFPDYRDIRKIKPGEVCKEIYKVHITSRMFSLGLKRLQLLYVSREDFDRKKMQKSKILYGAFDRLFTLYVK